MTSSSRIYSDMIDDLVRDLTGRSDVRRTSAIDRCGGLPEDLLLEITSKLLALYHKQVAWRWSSFILGAIGVVSFAYALQGNMLFGCGVVGLVAARHLQLTYRHTGRSLQGLLQNSEDTRLIPAILLKYSNADGSGLRPQLTRVRDLGLSQLLPYVAQSDDEMWTHQMRTTLAGILRARTTNIGLKQSVVHALNQIGDATAIPDLVRLTAPLTQQHGLVKRIWRRNPNSTELRDAAILCVDAIHSRVNRRQQQAVLLRASAADIPLRVSLPRAVDSGAYRMDLELTRPATPINSRSAKSTIELEEQCPG